MLLLLRPCSLSRFVGVCTASRKLCSAEPTRAVLEKHRTPTQGQWPRVLSVRLPCSLRIGPVDAMDADAVSVSLVGSPESPLRPTLKLGREDDSLTLSMSGAESKDLDGLLCCVRLPAMLSTALTHSNLYTRHQTPFPRGVILTPPTWCTRTLFGNK